MLEHIVWVGVGVCEVSWNDLRAWERLHLYDQAVRGPRGVILGFGTVLSRWQQIGEMQLEEFFSSLAPTDANRLQETAFKTLRAFSNMNLWDARIRLNIN